MKFSCLLFYPDANCYGKTVAAFTKIRSNRESDNEPIKVPLCISGDLNSVAETEILSSVSLSSISCKKERFYWKQLKAQFPHHFCAVALPDCVEDGIGKKYKEIQCAFEG